MLLLLASSPGMPTNMGKKDQAGPEGPDPSYSLSLLGPMVLLFREKSITRPVQSVRLSRLLLGEAVEDDGLRGGGDCAVAGFGRDVHFLRSVGPVDEVFRGG